MKFIIDRFEGDFAVCEKENGEMININIKDLPSEAKEGDCLVVKEDRYTIDELETKKRKEEIEKLMGDLFE